MVVVGGVISLVRRAATATGSSGAVHAASKRAPATATTVSDRIRRSGAGSGAGTAARYPTGDCHKPRQISRITCKVCSRSSSAAAVEPMNQP
jgi:hypothetical protein